jgi:hypothetical protein
MAVLVIAMHSVYADAITINFDTFPDSTPVPPGTIITTQYLSLGVSFSSTAGGPQAVGPVEASSAPNFLIGNPSSFAPIIMDLTTPFSGTLGVTLISVGDGVATATALASDLTTVLDVVSVTNSGTGVGLNNKDPITLTGAGIIQVRFEITQPVTGVDGFGIDDVNINPTTPPVDTPTPTTPIPEPSTYLLFATGLASLLGYGWRRKKITA